MSNEWWAIRVADVAIEKSLTGRLGSSTIPDQRTSTERVWVALKKANLEMVPVLHLRLLSAAPLRGLSNLFDQLAGA